MKLKYFPEFIAVPLAVAAWLLTIHYLPIVFPAMGIIDEGVVQVPILGGLFLLFNNAFVFAGIKFNFPSLWKDYENSFTGASLPYPFYVAWGVLHITLAVLEVALAS